MAAWTDEPVSGQIADDLAARIDAGEFDKTDQLPSIADLISHYLQQGLSATHGTVRLALGKLESDGLIKRRQGRPTKIVAKPSDMAASPAELKDAVRRVTHLEQVVERLDEQVSELTEEVRRLRDA